MSSVALVFSALAALSAPPPDLTPPPASPPPLAAPAAPRNALCGPQNDPRFVRYVPPAPAADGANPLLRWIAQPPGAVAPDASEATRCMRMLKRAALPR